MTFAGVPFAVVPATDPPDAQIIPEAMSATEPPRVPRTRTCCKVVLGATPTTPVESETAPMVPATCVPCQLELYPPPPSPGSLASESRPSPSAAFDGSEMKSYPGTVLESKSG